MTTAAEPWPCPVCVELIPVGLQDCPHCRIPAAWIDLVGALDFSIRRFHLWSLVGSVNKTQYRQLVDACRQRREEMVRAANAGQAVPADSGLVPRSECWSCHQPTRPAMRYCGGCGAPQESPEVRLFRYQTFLSNEIRNQEKAGRLFKTQAAQLLSETANSLSELRSRLSQAAMPVRA